MESKKPYLSVVMIARNDDYQNGGFERLQTSIDSFIVQARQHNLRMELIIVEWNPPEDRPFLKNALLFPENFGYSVVKFIIVPHSIHKTYRCSEKIKIIYPAAINVGVRRASGDFVLSTNSDIFLSDELMHFLSLEKLEKSRFYRAFRYDINRNVLKCASVKERMDFCKNDNNIIKAFINTNIRVWPENFPQIPALYVDSGDFILFSKECWEGLHGYPEINNINFGADPLLCYMIYLAGLKEEILESPMRIYHIDHDSRWRHSEGATYDFLRKKIYNKFNKESKLKFLMKSANMIKNKFLDFFLNNFYYPLVPFFQKIFPAKTWDFDAKYLLFELRKVFFGMLKGERSYIYNGDNWGLPNENFKEFIIKN